MDNPATTLQLQYPILWHKEEVASIPLRRIKMKDMKQLPADDVASIIMLFSRISDYPPAFFDELDAADMGEARKIIEGFMPKSQETGRKSSDGSPTE